MLIKSNNRIRSNIFSGTAGLLTKVEKNSADDIVKATDYDAPVNLKGDAPAGTDLLVLFPPSADTNLGMYQVGDLIAIRNEDGTAEPLGATKEEFKHITAIAIGDVEVVMTLDANLTNSYPRATSLIYNCIQKEMHRTGFDKNVTITEIWRNN